MKIPLSKTQKPPFDICPTSHESLFLLKKLSLMDSFYRISKQTNENPKTKESKCQTKSSTGSTRSNYTERRIILPTSYSSSVKANSTTSTNNKKKNPRHHLHSSILDDPCLPFSPFWCS